MKDIKRWLPGALISILLIAVILYFVDLRAMVDAMRTANYGMLAVAFAIGFLWVAVRAIVWRTLLRDRPSYGEVFWTVGEGYLLNNFLPFRLGELGRAFLLSRKSGMQFMEILPTIVIERAVDLGFNAAIFLSALSSSHVYRPRRNSTSTSRSTSASTPATPAPPNRTSATATSSPRAPPASPWPSSSQ